MSSHRSSAFTYTAEQPIDRGISVALTENGLVEIVAHNEFVYLTHQQFAAVAEFVREHPEEDE